jgi:hypothetical protein
MKTITVRLPEALFAAIAAEARARRISKSDVVRERLQGSARAQEPGSPPYGLADVIGSADGLPADLSARKKHYLRAWGYGRKRPR